VRKGFTEKQGLEEGKREEREVAKDGCFARGNGAQSRVLVNSIVKAVWGSGGGRREKAVFIAKKGRVLWAEKFKSRN